LNELEYDVGEEIQEKPESECEAPNRFKRNPLDIESILKDIVRGQDQAVSKIMPIIKRAWAGLNDPNRPIGIILLSGKTGIGKSLMAKALAFALFDGRKHSADIVHSTSSIYRIDCAELSNKGDVNRITGAPAGFVGHDNGSPLANFIKEHEKGCLILLDEAEKAEENVRNMFLGMFDRGELNDNTGKPVSARNCLFVLTTNIGSRELENAASKHPLGFCQESSTVDSVKLTERAIKSDLSPEFRNRLDESIIFNDLDDASLKDIAKIETKILSDRLKKRGSKMKISKAAINLIVDRANSTLYGGREIRRVVERDIATPLSMEIIQGNGTFNIGARQHEFTFTRR
jgi:ATP-dependent Clp protease ATP-binding subunit ClpA